MKYLLFRHFYLVLFLFCFASSSLATEVTAYSHWSGSSWQGNDSVTVNSQIVYSWSGSFAASYTDAYSDAGTYTVSSGSNGSLVNGRIFTRKAWSNNASVSTVSLGFTAFTLITTGLVATWEPVNVTWVKDSTNSLPLTSSTITQVITVSPPTYKALFPYSFHAQIGDTSSHVAILTVAGIEVNNIVLSGTEDYGGISKVEGSYDSLSGKSWSWTLDGDVVQSGVVAFVETTTYTSPQYDCNIKIDAPTPTPTSTPTPTPTPTPSPTPLASGTTPKSTQSNFYGGSGSSGTSALSTASFYDATSAALTDHGVTKSDFYDAMLEANKVAGNTSTAAAVTTGSADGSVLSGTVGERGQIDKVSEKQAQVFSSGSDAQYALDSKLSGFTSSVSSLPTSLGRVSSLHLGSVEIVSGKTADLSIDLTKPWVPIARGAMAAMVSLMFFATVLVTVRRYL